MEPKVMLEAEAKEMELKEILFSIISFILSFIISVSLGSQITDNIYLPRWIERTFDFVLTTTLIINSYLCVNYLLFKLFKKFFSKVEDRMGIGKNGTKQELKVIIYTSLFLYLVATVNAIIGIINNW
ncbi:MAG: hypothetical protein Fur003_2210 [Candidatus Dojkabacteria bacterium]